MDVSGIDGEMRRRLRAGSLALLLALCVAGPVPLADASDDTSATTPDAENDAAMSLRIRPLPSGVRKVVLEPDGSGGYWLVLDKLDGEKERIRPGDLADRIYTDHRDRRLIWRVLNITSFQGVAWVALGLLGQILFAGRMIVQWLVSERNQRSVVPVVFWWMSLAGASMLLTYFIWRKDVVGVLGQSTGWVIYVRNLWLIYRERGDDSASSPAPDAA